MEVAKECEVKAIHENFAPKRRARLGLLFYVYEAMSYFPQPSALSPNFQGPFFSHYLFEFAVQLKKILIYLNFMVQTQRHIENIC